MKSKGDDSKTKYQIVGTNPPSRITSNFPLERAYNMCVINAYPAGVTYIKTKITL
jgi:hypothetical protein